MLSVLGIGVAYPDNLIDNRFLVELGCELQSSVIEEQIGISTRRTTLPLEYLRETRNQTVTQAKKVALESPTDLACRAAQQALERAGIRPEQIGMVIGESATPVELTPAEGQRVAGRLGIRVPSYDVSAGMGTLALHLTVLNSWRDEATPEYVLCVSANTATQCVDYRRGIEGALFGDCGVAIVLSRRHHGKLRLTASSFRSIPQWSNELSIDTWGYVKVSSNFVTDRVEPKTEQIFKEACSQHEINPESAIAIVSEVTANSTHRLKQRLRLGTCWSAVRESGCVLGCAPANVLAQNWDNIREGRKIVIAVAGAGFHYGYLLFSA